MDERCKWSAPNGWQCPHPKSEGSRLCQSHRAYHAQYQRDYRARFAANNREANQRARKCTDCKKTKEPEAFYLPRKKQWMAYKEFYWKICKACMREKARKAKA